MAVRPPMNMQAVYQSTNTLYLGDINAAQNTNQLQQFNIGAIISVTSNLDLNLPQNIKHYHIQADDSEDQDLSKSFESSFNIINNELQYSNVLVHCFAGRSRSATIVCAYLMKKLNMSYEQAIEQVQQARRIAQPNESFIKQLKQYQLQAPKSYLPQYVCMAQKYKEMKMKKKSISYNN